MRKAEAGYITPRVSWPREPTPTTLTPCWAGEFRDFEDWVSKATTRLTGTYDPLMGAEIPSVCIDNIGRRCTMGGHFARARDEGTFPVRFFWDCAPCGVGTAPASNTRNDSQSTGDHKNNGANPNTSGTPQ